MKLEGIHHVTCITSNGPANAEFYVGVLGLRLVKKTVNQDDPTVYHLFYADEKGSAGADITFFEYPGVPEGRAGDGMIHRIVFRVAGREALSFWSERLSTRGIAGELSEMSFQFRDPEGLGLELRVDESNDPPLRANHPEVPEEFAISGFDSVRAYSNDPSRSRALFEQALGFRPDGDDQWEARGTDRGGRYIFDPPPPKRGSGGAGTVHHIAWASSMEEHETWRDRVVAAGAQPTPVIDRSWFRSVYFREPSGVLFEIATLGPGFTTDEPVESLGERLVLPPAFEHMRDRIEKVLKPIPNLRAPATSRGD